MRILLSEPITFIPNSCTCKDWVVLGREAVLSYEFGKLFPRRISDHFLRLYLAFSLVRKRKYHDILITGRYGEWFSLFQALVPYGRKRHILLDIEWPFQGYTGSKKARSIIARSKQRLIGKGATKIQVFCEVEAENYSRFFGISKEKFIWIPYCTDIDRVKIGSAEEDYIFTGGNQQRDYETLSKAVEDLPERIVVAAPREKVPCEYISRNMVITGIISSSLYFTMMAKAKVVVLSLMPHMLRCPGVITYVTAMRMGKCVIVNDPYGATSYIQNGSTGIIVNKKDPGQLREAIILCMSDDQLRKKLALNAKTYAEKNFSGLNYIRLIREVIDSCAP